MNDDWVPVGLFGTPEETHFAQLRLEEIGINTLIEGENTVSAYPIYSLAIGGVRLKTPASQAEQAARALEAVPPRAVDAGSEGTLLSDSAVHNGESLLPEQSRPELIAPRSE